MDDFNFAEQILAMAKLRETLPIKIAALSRNHFLNNWRLQGFETENGWKIPERKIEGTKEWKYVKKKSWRESATLVNTGKLRRGVNNSIASQTMDLIKLEVNDEEVAYAKFNNEGGGNLPQRKFMGESEILNLKIEELIDKELEKVF